jgi:hypothetical protein
VFAYSLFQALVNSDCIVSRNSFAGGGSAFDCYRDNLCPCATRICDKASVNCVLYFCTSVCPHVAIRESRKRLIKFAIRAFPT